MSSRAIYIDHSATHERPKRPVPASVQARPSPPASPVLTLLPPRPAAKPQVAPESEVAILAVLDAAPSLGETIDGHHKRKEQEFGAVFARLSVIEARLLHKRLVSPSADDPIATRFGRLITERRNRLLAFLLDARRREALASARR